MQIHRNVLFGLGLTFIIIFLCFKLISSAFYFFGVEGPSTVCRDKSELNCNLVSLEWKVEKKKTFAHATISAPARMHGEIKQAFEQLERRVNDEIFTPSYKVELILVDSEPAVIKPFKGSKKIKQGAQNG